MKSKLLTGLCALSVAAGTVGYFIGHSQASSAIDADSLNSPNARGSNGSTQQENIISSNAANDTSLLDAETSAANSQSALTAFQMKLKGPTTARNWMDIRAAALSLPPDQIQEAITLLQQLPISEERSRLERELLARWATVDPLAAIEYANNMASEDYRHYALEGILRAWASHDPEQALAWLESEDSNLSERQQARMFDDILRGYADYSFGDAIDYFAEQYDSLDRQQRYRAVSQLVRSMMQQGLVDQIDEYFSRLPEGEIRNRAYEELIDELTELDVQSATALLESFKGSEHFERMQNSYLRELADNDPAAAAVYVTGLGSEHSNFSSMASRVMREWHDTEAAANWLIQYEPSPALDGATTMLVYKIRNTDPETAVTWALSITNEKQRGGALRVIAASWRHNDSTAFDTFLSQSDFISDSEKELMKGVKASTQRGDYQRSSWGGWGGRSYHSTSSGAVR